MYSHGKEYQELNLDRLQHWITSGRIDASQPITMKHLLDSRCIHKIEDGVKLLSVVSGYSLDSSSFFFFLQNLLSFDYDVGCRYF